MMPISAISSLASEFPLAEVEYEDLFALRFQTDGRGEDGKIDCIGVVLEIYRRAGISLPDPKSAGSGVLEFTEMFDEIQSPDNLYDIVSLDRSSNHVLVVVRYGLALSATTGSGVYTRRVNILRRAQKVKFFRVKPGLLPT